MPPTGLFGFKAIFSTPACLNFLLTSPLKSSLKKNIRFLGTSCNSKFHFKSPSKVFTPVDGETICVEAALLPQADLISSHITADRERHDPLEQ